MAFPDNLRSLGELRSRYRRTRRSAHAGGVAFVFQGGGSLSAPQVGMLRALSEAGVLPDLVVGSSAGALNAVATDLGSGAAVVFSAGPTGPALLASCAFPGLYPPVEVDGRLLVDGGVSADVMVLQAEALGARVIYVLPAAGCDVTAPPPHRPLRLAFHALSQVLGSVAATNVAAARRPVHVLPAPGTQTTSPVDFRDTSRLIAQGHQLAARWLASQRADRPASPDLPVTRVAGASMRIAGAS